MVVKLEQPPCCQNTLVVQLSPHTLVPTSALRTSSHTSRALPLTFANQPTGNVIRDQRKTLILCMRVRNCLPAENLLGVRAQYVKLLLKRKKSLNRC